MKHLLFICFLLPFAIFSQTTDFHQLTGSYFIRGGGNVTINYSDADWSGEPENKIKFEANGFFHSMDYSETDAQSVSGFPVFKMEGLYYLVELEPGVLAQITATPTWNLDGKDRIAALYAKKKDQLSKWTDDAINQKLVKLSNK